MPQCEKCKEFLPPNYTEIIEGSNPNFEGVYPQECIFCKLDVDKVERESTPNSGNYINYTKEECIRDYKIFIGKMKKVADKEQLKKTLEDNPFNLE